jgi:RimJ/RimL family protein N-acetyltransferase
MTVIETDRLKLREMTVDDIDRLYQIYDDDEAGKYLDPLSDDRHEEQEKLQAYIDFVYRFYGFGMWAVCKKQTGRFIGRCGLSVEEVEEDVFVEIGYLIEAAERGRGFAEEAVRAVLDYAVNELELNEIAACIAPENAASIALARKTGFSFRKSFVRRGKIMQLYTYVDKS